MIPASPPSGKAPPHARRGRRGSTRWPSSPARSRSAYDGTPGADAHRPRTRQPDRPPKKVVRSITGEVTLDYGRGVCLVDAPKAQGACGFLGQAGPIKLRDIALNSANPFAAVLVVALDDQPLATNRRTLVQVTTAARPTDWDTAPAEFAEAPGQPKLRGFEITRTGKPPWRVADTQLGLAIKNPNLSKATRLDTAGYPAEDVPVTKTKTGITLTVPPDTMYLILE